MDSGVQSNHCRATAAAARLAGLEPHLVLLVKDTVADEDPGSHLAISPQGAQGYIYIYIYIYGHPPPQDPP